MKITVTESMFIGAFWKSRPNQFTYEGLKFLFQYLEGLENEMETQMELDVIGLCCDYCEYGNLKEFQDEYGKEYETMEDIENDTMVIPIDEESFIILQF